jgi:tetratricopeptide (TPR) repeat protein
MKKIRIVAITLVVFFYAGIGFAQTTPELEEAKKLTVREQYTQAEEMFKKLIIANPGLGDLYYYYGENELKALFSDTITRSQKETLANCKKLYEQGIEKDALNPLNFVGLARIAYISGNKQAVGENIAKVNTMIPAMNVKVKKIKEPVRYAQVLAEMAKIYIVPGKTDTASALPLLRRAVSVDPKNAELFNLMGDAYLEIRDVNNAIMNYNLSQSLDQNSPLAKLRIGYLYVRAKNLGAAIASLQEALRIDPNFAPAYKELGYVYSLAGKTELSKPNYEKYLQLSGNNIPAKISYVVALFKSADYKECIKQINQIFAVDSSINSMNRVIGYSYYETKQFVKAHYYMEKFLKNINYDPEKIISKDYIYMGRIMGERGFADKADEYLRKAIDMDVEYVDLYSDIALFQSTAKNYKRAIQALEDKKAAQAAKLGDFYYLGRYYYSDGNYEKANETFETLLGMNDPRLKSYEMLALTFQGYSLLAIDSTFEQGLPFKVYEKMVEKAMVDTVKFSKNLVDAYSYFASYYWLNKPNKDLGRSKKYFLMVLAIDPGNQSAQKALLIPEIKNAKLPEE